MTGLEVVDKNTLYRGLATSDDFRVFVGNNLSVSSPDQALSKGLVPSDTEVVKRIRPGNRKATSRIFEGYMSNQEVDRHRERLIQEGLDFDEFVNYGWFNDNHIQTSSAILGYPLSVELHRHPDHGLRWYGIGCLLEGDGLVDVDKVWNLARALSGLDRKMGLSVEGKILERSGPVIKRAIIRNVAITPYPVNVSCTWDVFVDAMEGTSDFLRALSGDNPITSVGGSGILISRNLEGGKKTDSYVCTTTGEEFATEKDLKAHQDRMGVSGGVKKAATLLDKSQAIRWIMGQDIKMSEDMAASLVDYVIASNRQREVSR